MIRRYSLTSFLSAILVGSIYFTSFKPAFCQSDKPIAYLPVRGHNSMVASPDEIASKVGLEILKKGGNAIDAAVAVGLALAVTWPEAGNIGGGGFMIVHTSDGRPTTIDYRETAPGKAHHGLYVDKDGNLIPNSSTIGYRAAGVPGTIAGFALALEKYGTMDWDDLIEPARKLTDDGFPLTFVHSEQFR